MAQSPSHRLGQYLGNILEAVTIPELDDFCKTNGLYLDKHGTRPGIRSGKKATWTDAYGNDHDLDFVIEVGASDETQGWPLAFIECAWRSYTKHSKNKAQEIQGAILPLIEKHKDKNPFKGAILAGRFTDSSLKQLDSLGFNVLYIPYEDYCESFERNGIDIRFEEKTPEDWFRECFAKIENAGSDFSEKVVIEIRRRNRAEIDNFVQTIKAKLTRTIEFIAINPLFGNTYSFDNMESAISFLKDTPKVTINDPFKHVHILVKYTNGDVVEGKFSSSLEAVRFISYVASPV